MKIRIVFFKTISAIFIYSILYSLLSAFRVDFIDLKVCKFEFTEFLSISFLMIIYLTFSFYILLIFFSTYLIEHFKIHERINILFLILIFLGMFYLLTLIFDSNFKDTNSSLNGFIYSCLSISLIVYILFGRSKTILNNKSMKPL